MLFFLGLQKDSADARALSFIKILENMPHMMQPPLMLFVENVVGFEVSIQLVMIPYPYLLDLIEWNPYLLLQTSNTHKHMMEVLAGIGFVTQEYILSPLQFGIPYSRPRYFCLVCPFNIDYFCLLLNLGMKRNFSKFFAVVMKHHNVFTIVSCTN